jgi:dephospho-CoA kinase
VPPPRQIRNANRSVRRCRSVTIAMLKLGLTGGIASGKSTVAALLRERGFDVIDADSLARKLIEPGQPAYDDVVREFGPGIVTSHMNSGGSTPTVTSNSGTGAPIDRKKLATIVFADRAKLDRLNAITHPGVQENILRQFDDWARDGKRSAAFVEAALLVEAGYPKYLDGLVVAWSTQEQQLERLRARGLSEEEARNRIGAQLPVAEKLKLATETIDCSGSLEGTRRQVEALAAKLR